MKIIKIFFSKFLSRHTVTVIFLIFQIVFLILAVYTIGERFYIVYLLLMLLDAGLVIYLMNKHEPYAYKLAWIVTISIFPLFGGLAYIYIKQSQKLPRAVEMHGQKKTRDFLVQDKKIISGLENGSARLAEYVYEYGMYPVYRNTSVEYFSLGELMFEAMIRELEKAGRFIFMEYFIISDGYMLDTVSEILVRKAAQGVEVRLMYDGIGTGIHSIEKIKELEKNGIECCEFSPFTPFLSSVQNNRDHRKITVIDGVTAFSGGANLADEYINKKERFGHWKDTAFMIKGEAVKNYVFMFVQLWNTQKNNMEYEKYLRYSRKICSESGFVQPFSDSPLDDEPVGRLVYTELIANASEYVYITTPYLITDWEIINILGFAAKKGVDVKIITPHIPDKWYAYMIAWNNYPKLIEAGVKIYEYTPGFIHAKTCIADGKTAVVGTINLDYRSFYLHFESAAVLYNCPAIEDIRRDIDETIALSHRITMQECEERPVFKKIAGALLSIFAPLL